MEIATARVGFCVGISRTYRAMNRRALAEDASFHVTHQDSGGELDTLRRIERRDPDLLKLYPGLEKISVVHDISTLRKGDRLILGFHGLTNTVKARLGESGVMVLDDLQCPFIARLNAALERLVREGFDIIIVGKKENHHCQDAQRLAEQHGRRCFVIEEVEDVESIANNEGRKLALVAQVTGNTLTFKGVVEELRKKEIPVTLVRTLCSDSYLRQGMAMDLAKEADALVILEDGGGAAQSVFEVCSQVCKRVRRIRSKEEIQREWFEGVKKVAILGGILVPQWSIEEVARHIREICV